MHTSPPRTQCPSSACNYQRRPLGAHVSCRFYADVNVHSTSIYFVTTLQGDDGTTEKRKDEPNTVNNTDTIKINDKITAHIRKGFTLHILNSKCKQVEVQSHFECASLKYTLGIWSDTI